LIGAGGLAEEVDEKILHAAFVPFGEVKDVKTPLDQSTQKHRSFGFVTFLEREDAAAAMDNMDGAELFGRVLTVNYAFPERIKGGEQGWAAQPSKVQCFLFLPHCPIACIGCLTNLLGQELPSIIPLDKRFDCNAVQKHHWNIKGEEIVGFGAARLMICRYCYANRRFWNFITIYFKVPL